MVCSMTPHLSEAQAVGHDAVHGVGVHLRPLQLEVKDSRPVLPQRVVGVVVELGRVGLPCRGGERRCSEQLAATRSGRDAARRLHP